MKSQVVRGLLWEQWRQTWKFVGFSALFLGLYAYWMYNAPDALRSLLFYKLYGGTAVVWAWLVVLVAMGLLFTSETLRGLRLDLPRHLFVLPVRTGTLLAVHLGYKLVLAVIFGLALGMITTRILDAEYPVWLPAAVMVVLVTWMQAFVCLIMARGVWRGSLWFLLVFGAAGCILTLLGIRWHAVHTMLEKCAAVPVPAAVSGLAAPDAHQSGSLAQPRHAAVSRTPRGKEGRQDAAVLGQTAPSEAFASGRGGRRTAAKGEAARPEASVPGRGRGEIDTEAEAAPRKAPVPDRDAGRKATEAEAALRTMASRRMADGSPMRGGTVKKSLPGSRKSFDSDDSAYDWNETVLAGFGAFAAMVVGWAIALSALGAARRGAGADTLLGHSGTSEGAARQPGLRGAIRNLMSTPLGMQVWFECRNVLWWLPALVVVSGGLMFCFVVLKFGIGYAGLRNSGVDVIFVVWMLQTVPLAIAFAVGYYALRGSPLTRTFCGTRPLSTGQLAMAKLIAGFLAILMSWIMLFLVMIVFVALNPRYAHTFSVDFMTRSTDLNANLWIAKIFVISTLCGLWVSLFMGRLMFLAFFALSLMMAPSMLTGGSAPSVVLVMLLAAVCVPVLLGLAVARVRFSWHYWMAILLIGGLVMLGPIWNMGAGTFDWWLSMTAERILVLAPFGWVPLVIHWQRHR